MIEAKKYKGHLLPDAFSLQRESLLNEQIEGVEEGILNALGKNPQREWKLEELLDELKLPDTHNAVRDIIWRLINRKQVELTPKAGLKIILGEPEETS
jgi:hypothetical protein